MTAQASRSVRFSVDDSAMQSGHAPSHPSSGSGDGSTESAESDQDAQPPARASPDDADRFYFATPITATPIDDVPPLAASGSASAYSWSSSGLRSPCAPLDSPTLQANGSAPARTPRPSAVRTPSNAYAPARRPNQFSVNTLPAARHRTSSATRARRNPNADYRAQERAYVQRIRQDNQPDEYFAHVRTPPSLDYSTGSDTDDDSPSAADYVDNDAYDQETLLYNGTDDMTPSVEELKIPANRERLEWHSMLANVLTGDVVKQEKKRLIGSSEREGDNSLKAELWTGVRARVCGRSLPAQRRFLDDGRLHAKSLLETIVAFEIQGAAEAGQSAAAQVDDAMHHIETVESLYPSRQALEAAHPRAASHAYKDSCDAIIAWHNTTCLINTESNVLKKWVGNDELDFSRSRPRSGSDHHLTDHSSFLDRILKEDGLKSLQRDPDSKRLNLLDKLEQVILKAKATLIANAEAFAVRHLPPYIEELLTLINFPSRLVQEIIRMRLSYAKKIKDPANHGAMLADQMISQFQILLALGCRIKEGYTIIAQPEPGWDPPPCIEENFDTTVIDALRFYFKMLNWKLSANKDIFKGREAEVLEQEWEFASKLGRALEGGDVEVAEQFRCAKVDPLVTKHRLLTVQLPHVQVALAAHVAF